MSYDGSLRFDTKIDTTGFMNGLGILKKAGVAGGAAITAGFGAAIKKGMDFEAQMSTVKSISGATSDEMVLLKKKAEEMGAKTVFSASASGKAFEYMAMAGWKTEDMLGGIEGIMNLAAASGESLATTSDIATDALTAFGLKASDSAMFADVLAAAASNSNTNVGMMGETFKYVAPVAGSLGYNVKDVAVGIGLMANAGIKGGQAGTSLRAVLTRLVKPTKQSAQAMDNLGISITDSKGKMKPFNQLMLDLRASFSKLTPAEKASNAALLGGQEAMSGLLAIVNASDEDFNKLTEAINNSTGAAQEMSDTRLDNLSGDLEELSGAAETLGLRFYDGVKGPIREAVQSATGDIDTLCSSLSNGELSGALDNVGDALGGLVSGAASFATGAVPVVISGISALSANITPLSNTLLIATGVIGGYRAAVGTVTTITNLWGAATGALSNPFGIAGIAIGGLATAGIAVYNAVKNAKTEFYNMGDALDETAVKFQETKDKATLTSDYAQKWRDLNKAISDGSLSGENLKNAEAERKGIEEWFIQNYGQYISAEQQKNGIREEVIDAIEEQVQILSEKQRLELENQALEQKRELPDLTKNIADMQARNKELNDENLKLLQNNNAALKAMRAWEALSSEQQMSGEYQELYNQVLAECNKALGIEASHLAEIQTQIDENDSTIEKNNKTIEKNNTNIADSTDSLQSYADACRGLIEQNLGDTLEGFANGYNLVKQAQDEVNTSGKISADTIQALIEKYPEMKEGLEDSDKAPQALADKMVELEGKLGDAWKKADEFETKLNGLPKELNIDINLNVPEIPQFAHGTTGASAGPAIVNDGNGPELIQSRNGIFRMVRSTGAALTWLNAGDRVYTAEQTRRILRGVPRYANGIGNEGYAGVIKITTVTDKGALEQFENRLKELKLSLELAAISEEEYYNHLNQLRINLLKEGSEEWFEYGAEVSQFLQKQAEKRTEEAMEKEFKALERELDLEFITEAEYYEKLAELRDKYYSEGSEEYQEYSDEIYKYHKKLEEEARDKDFNRLKKSLDWGYITEKEYYSKLKAMRDTYFEEGSDEWQQYTDEITDYYRGKVTGMTSALNNELNSAAKLFYNNSIILVGEGKGKELTKDGWIDHEGEDITLGGLELNDLSGEIESAKQYFDTLEKFKGLGLDEDIFNYIAGLERSEALKQANIFLSASAEELEKFKHDYAELKSLNKNSAENLYGDGIVEDYDFIMSAEEAVEKADEVGREFTAELEKYFSEVPKGFYNYGVQSANSFGDGFIDTIKSVMDEIASQIKADIEIASEKLKNETGGGTVINNYSTNNSSYTIASSKETVSEQLKEIRRSEEYERLRG